MSRSRPLNRILPLILPLVALGCQEPSVTEPAQGDNPFAPQAEPAQGAPASSAEASGPAGPPAEPGPAGEAGAEGAPAAEAGAEAAGAFEPASAPAAANLAEPTRSDSGRVLVERPRKGERVGTLIRVEGTALVWGNRVHVQVLNGEGDVALEGFADAKAAEIGESGPFTVDLNLSELDPGAITLVVMGHSAEDGSPEHVVKLPLDYGMLTAQ